MTSPFLSFDSFLFIFDFMIVASLLLFLSTPIIFMKNTFTVPKKKATNFIKSLFPTIPFEYSGLLGGLIVVFFVFSAINLFSLWTFLFTPTAHMILTFSFGFSLWLSTILIQLVFFFHRKMAHLTPQGTPIWLIFVMVIIEIMSQIIRPITLSVRLAANLTAGHLILSLLASLEVSSSLFVQLPLILLELLVALVQPFVFCMLLYLYFSEN